MVLQVTILGPGGEQQEIRSTALTDRSDTTGVSCKAGLPLRSARSETKRTNHIFVATTTRYLKTQTLNAVRQYQAVSFLDFCCTDMSRVVDRDLSRKAELGAFHEPRTLHPCSILTPDPHDLGLGC